MLIDQKWLLENMLKLNLPISRIASKLDVSRPVVYNTIEQYTIKLHAVHWQISQKMGSADGRLY